jgi:hypothetical protein
MSEGKVNRTVNGLTIEQWLQIRKREGRTIDPDTVEVKWEYARPVDPYGVHQDLPEVCQQVVPVHFARSPESDIWVAFCDLPDEARELLWERLCEDCRFPAGFSDR